LEIDVKTTQARISWTLCGGRRWLSVALLACSGCISWFHDERPWVVNTTSEKLEIESFHADGHTLKIMLYPGTRVPLGAAEEPVRGIAVRRSGEPEELVPESEIRSCLEDRERGCQGWRILSGGLEAIEDRAPIPLPPAPASLDPSTDYLTYP
jgi:hypothetical protein